MFPRLFGGISAADFFQAVKNNNLATVKNYISQNETNIAVINQSDPTKTSFALIIAAQAGYLEIVNALLAVRGIDANVVNEAGDTALIVAARNGHLNIVQVLLSIPHLKIASKNKLEKNAAQEASDHSHPDIEDLILTVSAGRAFRKAVRENNMDFINRFLTANSNNAALMNAVDHRGVTALHIAASKGFTNIVSLLVRAPGTQINLSHHRGITALIEAAHNNHAGCVSALISAEGIDVNSVDSQGNSALFHAASRGHSAVVQVLLTANGINLDLQNNAHLTAAQIATQKNHFIIAQMITAKLTPLPAVRHLQNAEVVTVQEERLGEQHANVVSAPRFLGAAAQRNQSKVQDYIAANQNDPVAMNVTDKEENTALHLAAYRGHEDIVTALIAISNVNINAINRDGNTALMLAVKNGFIKIVDILLQDVRLDLTLSNKQYQTAGSIAHTLIAPEIGHMIDYITKRRYHNNLPDPSITHEQFLRAARSGILSLVQAYLWANWNNEYAINVVDSDNCSALHCAAQYRTENSVAIVNALVAAPRVNVNIINSDHDTPLMAGARSSNSDANTIAALLRIPGIDLNITDNEGNNAAEIARLNEHWDVANLIEEAIAQRSSLQAPPQSIESASNPAVTAEAFLNAVRNRRINIVEAYIAANQEHYDRMNVTDAQGNSALHLAARYNHEDYVAITTALGDIPTVDVNILNRQHETPLMVAVRRDNANAVTALLALNRLVVNIRGENGNTALMQAANNSRSSRIIDLLLHDLRVDPTLRNNANRTAAEMATIRSYYGIASTIFDAVTRWRARSGHFLNPLPVAAPSPAPSINEEARLFLRAAERGDLESVQQYIRNHRADLAAAINVADPATGNTALIIAAGVGGTQIVNELLNTQGMDITIQNREALNAAQVAERNNQSEIAGQIMQLLSARSAAEPPAAPNPVSPIDAPVLGPKNFEQRLAEIGFNEDDIPNEFKCPITRCIMNDPVSVASGQTYDRPALEGCFRNGRVTYPDPLTREIISVDELKNHTNQIIKSLIEKFVSEQEKIFLQKKAQAEAQAAALAPIPAASEAAPSNSVPAASEVVPPAPVPAPSEPAAPSTPPIELSEAARTRAARLRIFDNLSPQPPTSPSNENSPKNN